MSTTPSSSTTPSAVSATSAATTTSTTTTTTASSSSVAATAVTASAATAAQSASVTSAQSTTTTTTSTTTTNNPLSLATPSNAAPSSSSSSSSTQQPTQQPNKIIELEKIYQWINELCMPSTRETALIELSRQREAVQDLAPMLWHSFGSIAALLQEVINVYPAINPPTLTAQQSNRVCNSLALLQCVASHPETRSLFLQAHIPIFLYPFLHTTSCKTRPFEYLRLTSLGVIGALVKTDEQDVITFLLSTEIIPLCLKIMEYGSELSKTVATFILQKILTDETGLAYICQTYERFSHVAKVLGLMVLNLVKESSSRLLKHVVRCYLRLSDNPRAKEALKACLPDQLKDSTFYECLKDDQSTKRWLAQLIKNLEPFTPLNAQQPTQSTALPQLQSSISPSAVSLNQFN